jgi:hypothetical protein
MPTSIVTVRDRLFEQIGPILVTVKPMSPAAISSDASYFSELTIR